MSFWTKMNAAELIKATTDDSIESSAQNPVYLRSKR